MKKTMTSVLAFSLAVFAIAQTSEGSIDHFRKPAKEIEELTMAAPLPSTYFNSSYTKAVMGYTECKSIPVAELAGNELRIGGVRLNPENFSTTREAFLDRLQLLDVATGSTVEVAGIPSGLKIRNVTWSPDGKMVAFTATGEKSVDLYLFDSSSAAPKAEKINSARLNSTLGSPFLFLDSSRILYKAVPADRLKTPTQDVAKASVIQENLGERKSGLRTYEDLLSGPFDELLYDYCCTSVLNVYSPEGTKQVGGEAIYRSIDPSPNGEFLMTVTEHHPYSYIEAHRSFTSRQFIMDLQGNVVKMIKDGTVKEEKKADEKGPRKPQPGGFSWRADKPAVLVWTESKAGAPGFGPGGPGPGGPGPGMPPPPGVGPDGPDGPGGPDAKSAKPEDRPEETYTDKMFQCEAPFNYETDKTLVLAPEYKLGRVSWSNDGFALFEESSTKQKFRRMVSFVPCDTLAAKHILYSQSTERDSLGTFPVYGNPYTVRNSYGKSVVWTDAKNSQIYMSGANRTDAEGFPVAFVDRLTVKDAKAVNVWTARNNGCEEKFIAIADFGKQPKIIQTVESFNVVPDYYMTDLKKGSMRQITHIVNSVPQISELYTHQYVKYTRKDGVQCYGNLYLPKGYDKERDGRLPMLMWTYPYEYKSTVELDKDRPARNKYLKPTYGSAQIWASQGYAVLDEFTMAIVSEHPDSLPNNVFLEQLVMSAESAIDFVVDSLGIADRDRIGVGGHSYGGFMTANLLAHTRLYRAGIARSGAYMRSLTPFGFQSERRNYWKAKTVYDEMSPFNYADKLKDAILIIHGQLDDNMGTFPVQSERLYQALVYNGGTARYVQLPYEAHSYLGKETTLDMLYETGAWLDKYVKNAKPREEEKTDAKK